MEPTKPKHKRVNILFAPDVEHASPLLLKLKQRMPSEHLLISTSSLPRSSFSIGRIKIVFVDLEKFHVKVGPAVEYVNGNNVLYSYVTNKKARKWAKGSAVHGLAT